MENLMPVKQRDSNQIWGRWAWSCLSAVLPTWTSD